MASFDYDVVIVDSGFGGSVAALRAPEACPFSGGLLIATTIMRQCHRSRFDITTGAVVSGPACRPLNVYSVQEVEDAVRIQA